MTFNSLTIALALFVLAAILLFAVYYQVISDHLLQRLANIGGIIAAIAGILIFVLPSINDPPTTFSQLPTLTFTPTEQSSITLTPVPMETPTLQPTSTSTHTPTIKSTDSPTPISVTNTATNTRLPIPTLTDTPVPASPLCPDIVDHNTIEPWNVGAVEIGQVQSYIAAFDSHRMIGGGFVQGDTIPAGVLIATDFGNGQSEAYQTYPVKPIVHFRSWGLFEVEKSFSAPHEGACITIRASASSPQPVVGTNDPRDVAAKTVGYSSLDELMKAFEIPIEVKPRVFVCPNEETWCLSVFEEQGQLDFHFNNALSCTLDGKQSNGISNIPAGFDGTVKGFTIRRCPR